ncbi:MAG: SDR family oxidoreductase [bacterium]|nr:SDR family oxidoreductase [bacterium]
MDFDDKVVLVTGASGGIGRAVCRKFAAGGARVFAHYLSNPEAADQTLAELAGGPHRTVRADLRDAAAVKAMIDEVVADAGRLDVLVNNAGRFEHHPLAEVSYEEWQESWDRILSINLVGAANAAYCAARQMIRQGGGRVINISSRGAFRGEPDGPAYGASKAGLNAMSQSLAKALAAHGIFVYAVAPGFVETAMARDYLTGDMAEAIRNQSPLGRVATADDVAYWVVCLAAEGAEFATGAIIDVNGASYLRT